MKKHIYLTVCLAAAALAASCVKDTGNYDYLSQEELQPVSISGIDDEHHVKLLDSYHITPTVDVPNEEDYEFCWYIYGSPMKERDTVSMGKELDFTVTQPSGSYQLVFQVKNKHTGVCTWDKSKLWIASEFSRGWYITKDENDMTDLDWIKPDGTVVPNVLTATNGEGVPGKANHTTFMGSRYNYDVENEDGTTTLLTNQGIYFVMSDRDMRVYHQENLKLIRTFDRAFVYEPETAAPQQVAIGSFIGAWAVNDGKVSSLSLFTSPSYGKFGYPKLGDYRAAEHILRDPLGSGIVVFDELTSSFMWGAVGERSMQRFNRDDALVTDYDKARDGADMDCDLIFLRDRPTSIYFGNDGFGIMKKKGEEKYYSFIMNADATSGGNKLFKEFRLIPEGRQVGKGKVFGAHNVNSTLYFSLGDNVLRTFNMSNHAENDNLFTFPEGEKISFISHVIYEEYSDLANALKCLAVITNDGSRWHLYCFDFVSETADIVTEAGKYRTYSGNGHASAAIYRGIASTLIN